jgi:predicted regulator of Ras-like GTPase activity (Roadblock/LC7/MglB family)
VKARHHARHDRLRQLIDRNPDIQEPCIIDLNGDFFTSLMVADSEPPLTPKLAAAFTLGQQLAAQWQRGTQMVCVQTKGLLLVLLPVDSEYFLSALLRPDADFEQALAAMRAAADDIRSWLPKP